ncbi:MAG: UPF0182 family membrane protein [Candidatus Dormibacteria bacterium]
MQFRRGDFFDNIEPLFGRGGQRPGGPTWKPGAGAYRGAALLAVLLLLLFVIGPLIRVYTDVIWFRSLGYDAVILRRLGYQWVLGSVGFALAFAFLGGNFMLALSGLESPALRAIGVQRNLVRTIATPLVLVLAALFALGFATAAAGAWETIATAINGGTFGKVDPVFGSDIGFYVFTLPVLQFVWGWALGLVILAAIGVAGMQLLRGGPGGMPALPRSAVIHVSILAALLLVLLGAHQLLAMRELLLTSHGAVQGAGFTDLNVRIPARWIMLVVAAIGVVVMLLNARLNLPALPVFAIAAWAALDLVAAGIVPALAQSLLVKPAELSREHDYIGREIAATNTAFGLDALTARDFPDKQAVTTSLLADNPGTVQNLRLWDYAPLQAAYQQLQTIRSYYDFVDVDIDRYHLPDGYRQVMISARELSPDKLPVQAHTWLNVHLKYTHGYGAAATPVTRVANEGKPALILQDIPPVGDIKLDRPQVYFGESAQGYVVVDSKEPEFDYPKGDTESYTHWTGTHGVRLGSFARRLAFAARFADLNLLISGQVTGDSQVLYHRSVTERLQTLAPFLQYDHDPYLVVSGGKMYWIVDAYTTSPNYPYSSPVRSDILGNMNYIRNSVKVVIDAYEGTTDFYIADPTDPVVQAYARTFPSLFKPISAMPTDIRSHVRYPEDIFSIQAERLSNFHMHDPQDFYNRADSWAIPTEITAQGGPSVPLQPYYVLMRLPGEAREEFVLIQPYTPLNKNNMVAWVAARSDGDNNGKLLNFRFPTGSRIDGPGQVEGRIDQDITISKELTLLNQNGSRVIRGNLLVIPIGDAILFVEPVYIEATNGQAGPELKKVILADANKVAYADTLGEALAQIVGGTVDSGGQPSPSPTPGGPTPAVNSTVQQLIAQADSIFNQAQADLRAGDLKKYADDIDRLGQVLKQLRQQGGGSASPSPSPSP